MPDWYTNPSLVLASVFVMVGFYGLIKGADFLVEGAVVVARRFNMTPAVIGATVVAFGTSLPELVVSIGSNLKAVGEGQTLDPTGPAAIATGNVVGSNIFNIGAILGLSAMLRALHVPVDTLKRDFPIMLLALLALMGFAHMGEPSAIMRHESAILFAGLVGFTLYALKTGKVDIDDVEIPFEDNPWKATGLILFGITLLGVGGEVSLTGAISLARWFEMSERVIGLTIMAIGTSLPELATSIAAVRKGQTDIAVANVIGSNIFNVFCIIGLSGMVLPLPIPTAMLSWDLWWMFGFSAVLYVLVQVTGHIHRWMGFAFFGALVFYVSMLLMNPELGG